MCIQNLRISLRISRYHIGFRMVPKSSDCVFIGRGADTELSCQDGGRDWSDAATSQGMSGAPRSWKRRGRIPPEPSEDVALPTTDLRLLVSGTVGQYISVAFSPSFWQPHKTHTEGAWVSIQSGEYGGGLGKLSTQDRKGLLDHLDLPSNAFIPSLSLQSRNHVIETYILPGTGKSLHSPLVMTNSMCHLAWTMGCSDIWLHTISECACEGVPRRD